MLVESIYQYRGVSSILSFSLYFSWKILFEKNIVDPDQTPHDMASDLGLHCLLMPLFAGFQVKNGLFRDLCFQYRSTVYLTGLSVFSFNLLMPLGPQR